MSRAGAGVQELVLKVDAATELARRNLHDLERHVARMSTSMDGSLAKVDSAGTRLGKSFDMLKGAAGGFVAALGAGAVLNAGRDILKFADDLDAAAQKAGISVERYQSLSEAFRRLELDTEQTDKILKAFSLTVGQVQSGVQNEATKAFTRLGISAKILSGDITDGAGAMDAFIATSDKAGTALQYTSDAAIILGKKLGVDFASATNDGGAAMKQFEDAVRDAGLVLSEDLVGRLADANESIDQFAAQTKVGMALLAGELLEIFDSLGGAWDTVTGNWMGSIDAFGKDAFFSISRISDDINKLIDGTFREVDALVNKARDGINTVRFQTNLANNTIDRLTPDFLIKPDAQLPMLGKSNLAGNNANSRTLRRVMSGNLTGDLPLQASQVARAAPSASSRPARSGGGARRSAGGGGSRRRSAGTGSRGSAREVERPMTAGLRAWENLGPEQELFGFDFSDTTDGLGAVAAKLVDVRDIMAGIKLPPIADILPAEDQERIERFAMDFKNDIAGGLADAIVYGEDLGDVLENTFKRAAAAMIQSGILNFLTGGKEGTSFGTLFANVGSLFGGARAAGGPVSAGKAYLVGEKGPELFQPRISGNIVPNHALGGGGGRAFHFDLRGAVVTQDLLRQMNEIGQAATIQGARLGSAAAQAELIRRSRRTLL